jgi:hypothetical protein
MPISRRNEVRRTATSFQVSATIDLVMIVKVVKTLFQRKIHKITIETAGLCSST